MWQGILKMIPSIEDYENANKSNEPTIRPFRWDIRSESGTTKRTSDHNEIGRIVAI